VLSQEHHHALVFCARLKKANQTDAKTLQFFVNDFWITNTAAHFENEELWLLPIINDVAIKNRFLDEHLQIRNLIKDIKHNNGDIIKKALELADVLHHHVRFEERIMFPYLEKTISADKMAEIGIALSEVKISCQKFTPEFWKNEN